MDYPCISCRKEVRPRQHAVACDVCSKWQHRTCNTGISQNEYRSAVCGNKELSFICRDCSLIGHTENVDLNHSHKIHEGWSDELNLPAKPETTKGFDDSRDEFDQTTQQKSVHGFDDSISDGFDLNTRSKPLDGLIGVRSDVLEGLKDCSKPKPFYNFSDSSDDEFEDSTPARYDRQHHLDTEPIDDEKIKRRTKQSTYWRCSRRSKNWQCGMAVTQTGACFTVGHGYMYHNHLPSLHRAGDAQLKVKINEKLPTSTDQTARSIILESLEELNGNCDKIPLREDHMLKLIRVTNRTQAKLRQSTCREPAMVSGENIDAKNPPTSTLPMYSSAKREKDGNMDAKNPPISTYTVYSSAKMVEKNKGQPKQQTKASTRTANELSKADRKPIQESKPVLNKTFTINPEDKSGSSLPTRVSTNVKYNAPTVLGHPPSQPKPNKVKAFNQGYPCTARSIVENVLIETFGDLKNVDPSLNITNLIRRVNRHRAKVRKEYFEGLALTSGTTDDVIGLSSTGSGKPRPLQPPKEICVEVDQDSLRGKDEDRPV